MHKVKIESMAKESSRGVFWVIDNVLYSFPFSADIIGVSKSGLTYNHRKLWNFVKPRGCNKVWNYYPRGRVDFSNKGKPIIYMNLNVNENLISQIKIDFGLREEPKVMIDHSDHYKCYLDEGWKPL